MSDGENGKRVSIVSPFRDSEAGLPAYKNRINLLDYPPELLRLVCVEGDSIDHTYSILYGWASEDRRVSLVKCQTNHSRYPSLVSKERFAHLAAVFNAGLDAVDTKWSDYVMFLPSDVLYGPDLIKRLMSHNKDMISPMFWAPDHGNKRFYDIWGFRRDGESFKPYPPAWYYQHLPHEPVKMDTVGGVNLMNINVLKLGCRYTADEVDHGLCKMAQAEGLSVWCDPTTHIVHGD